MSDNPYQASELDEQVGHAGKADPTLDQAVLILSQTRPWVRLVSVMMFLGSAFMVFGGISMVLVTALGQGAIGGGISVFLGGIYLAMAVAYLFPAVFLWKYANRITLFAQQQSTARLADALDSQRLFWKFVGIMILAVMGIYALIIVIAIFAGIASSV